MKSQRVAAHPYQELALSIMEKIDNGDLPPGSKLPSVRSLAKDHDVSSMTAQKALLQLAQDGYAEAVSGLGYYALEPPTDSAADETGESLAEVTQQLRQLQSEVRALAARLEHLEQESAD
ncbi:GntR family transcriptional regulator [Saccharopolyspora halophila]|uniref:GntR family transcriptional regulator n=1 Tax=Saccharopolyspora halophila TaxID=405551 RepID=A0ABN3GEH7_9PSEU